jgi:hypothetical protein
MQVKGGAGWAAVEYAKWEVEHGQRAEGGRLVVVPVGVVYTDKTVYRSRVGHPLLSRIICADFEDAGTCEVRLLEFALDIGCSIVGQIWRSYHS